MKKQSKDVLLTTPITLFIGANADGENEGPSYAAVSLTPGFLGKIERLRGLVTANNLAYATIWDSPQQWGCDDGWNIHVNELRVSERGWYYTGSPKHCDYYVGTRSVTHEDTLRLIKEAQAADKAYAVHECDEAELIDEGILPVAEAAGKETL